MNKAKLTIFVNQKFPDEAANGFLARSPRRPLGLYGATGQEAGGAMRGRRIRTLDLRPSPARPAGPRGLCIRTV
jgi:hypothetical protein